MHLSIKIVCKSTFCTFTQIYPTINHRFKVQTEHIKESENSVFYAWMHNTVKVTGRKEKRTCKNMATGVGLKLRCLLLTSWQRCV